MMFSERKIESGAVYGWWTVVGPGEMRRSHRLYVCRCKCGVEKQIDGVNLRRGDSRSCGCGRAAFWPLRDVNCEDCGAKIQRKAPSRGYLCVACSMKRRDAAHRRSLQRNADQARKYRILMTTMGWSEFDELMDYLRLVPWCKVGRRTVRDLRSVA